MKKIITSLVILFIFFIISLIFGNTDEMAYADDVKNEYDEVAISIDELLESFSFDDFQSFLDSIDNDNSNYDILTLIKQVVNNEFTLDYNFFISYILEIFFGNLKGIIIKILIVLVIVILMNTLKNLTSGFEKKSTEKIVSLVGTTMIIGLLASFVLPAIQATAQAITNISGFTSTIFPILITCMTFIGASAEVAVYQPLMLIFAEVIIKIVEYIILPMFYVSFVFGIIGNLSEDLKFEKISSFALSLGKTVLSIVFGLFITYITAQGITGASIDSLAGKGAKYALQNYVPVIGNYLKDGFDIITAGCIVIKNSFGFVSIILILIYMLIPILKIVFLLLALKFTAALCEPFGEKKITTMFSCVADSIKIPLIVCISLSFVMIIFVMLIVLTGNRGII